ncbi:MAG: aldehyde dehydrogenase family protein, partial [Bacteroidota bacterium]
LIPLVSAVAAGNTVIIKPSEVSSHTSKVVKDIINSIFPEEEVAVVEGGIPETTALLEKPFNHIFFTGAPSIGKIVMKAASKHLTSVSLELGGKSPTIVDATANIEKAAARIAWSKSLNNGQICIAPDYLLIHDSVKDAFVGAYKKQIDLLFEGDSRNSESYGRIISNRHFQRLSNYLKDAKSKNAKVLLGGETDAADQYIAPTLITNLDDSALLWQEEIFGPIMPLKTYSNLEEVISYINNGEKPLALYIYSNSQKNIDKVINETRSGAVGVNYSATHYVNPNLPFGGSNNSGIGKGNGFYGFKAFSNAKGIQKHWSPFDTIQLFYPPYTKQKDKLVHWISKWLA